MQHLLGFKRPVHILHVKVSNFFFFNIYLRCKNFQCSIGDRLIGKIEICSMFMYINRWEVFCLRLLFSVRLGLQLHASYQIIDRRYVIVEAHSEIVM